VARTWRLLTHGRHWLSRHLDCIMLAPTPHCRLVHDGNTALQHCIVCMRHDMAMISKASRPVRLHSFRTIGSNFFGLRIAAHSSLQKVFEPWQLAAMLFQSSLQLECEWALLATEGEWIGRWDWLASAFCLCYEKATKGVWRMCIDCASIS